MFQSKLIDQKKSALCKIELYKLNTIMFYVSVHIFVYSTAVPPWMSPHELLRTKFTRHSLLDILV